MRKAKTLKHHQEHSCNRRTPPGKLIYEDKKYSDGTFKGVSAYMIDGREDKLYCQNLSLMAKLFIDHKILYFDIRDYQFFVLTQDSYSDSKTK